MAAAFSVEQAVQRLLHKVSRPGSEMTVLPSIHETRNSTSRASIFDKSPEGGKRRSASHSRYADLNSTTNRIYSIIEDPNFPLPSIYREIRQNGKNSTRTPPTNFDAERIFENGAVQEILPMGASNSTADVQNGLKNILISQLNVINQQKQRLAAQEREIEDLRRENAILKNSLHLAESRLTTPPVAQQHDSAPATEIRTRSMEISIPKSTAAPIKLMPDKAIPPQIQANSGGSSTARPRRAVTKTRSRQSSDLTIGSSTEISNGTGSNGRRRSGRNRRASETPNRTSLVSETLHPQPEKPPLVVPSKKTVRNRVTRRKPLRKDDSQIVQIPLWRVRPFTVAGALEGTEDLTNEAFVKRHQKLEIEERRLIRRDMMRQREELMRERMSRSDHQYQAAARKRGKDDLETTPTPPDVSELESIEICEKLPVGDLLNLPPSTIDSTPSKKRKKAKKN